MLLQWTRRLRLCFLLSIIGGAPLTSGVKLQEDVPMRNREILRVIHAAMKAINHTEFVLRFHRAAREGGAPMDLGPHIEAMMRLCDEQHLDDRPIEHLRQLKAVVDQLRGPVDTGALKAGERSALQYEEWLSSAFPGAFAQMRKRAVERTQKHRAQLKN